MVIGTSQYSTAVTENISQDCDFNVCPCVVSVKQNCKTTRISVRVCNISARPITIKSRKENPQKLTKLSPRSHSRHPVGKRTAQKDAIKDITSESQVNSYFLYRWSPASLTINIYFYLFFIFI